MHTDKIGLLLILFAVSWLSCKKSSSPPGPSGPSGPTPPAAPTIATVAPDSGAFNTVVVITGTNFSSTTTQDIVSFNGVAATVNSATATQLNVVVPKGAGTGIVKVTVASQAVSGPVFNYLFTYTVSTLAGGTRGDVDGTGSAAEFYNPWGLAIDTAGNLVLADATNNKIKLITPAGVVTTISGGGPTKFGHTDGPAGTASFFGPTGVAVDAGNNIFVADVNNYRVREISAGGSVSTIAGSTPGHTDGAPGAALFFSPSNLTLDASGNIYLADASYVRVISSGSVSTLFNVATYSSTINGFEGIVYGQNNNLILVSDGLYVYNLSTAGAFSTLAGNGSYIFEDGAADSASFNDASGVAMDVKGNIFVADQIHNMIRMITPAGRVSTIAGSGMLGDSDGSALSASFYYPEGVAVDKKGNIYVAEPYSNRIRKISAE
jgi:sugar lactone lactonase YvrE